MENIKKLILCKQEVLSEQSVYEALSLDVIEGINVELVSIWLFNDDNSTMTCQYSLDKNEKYNLKDTVLLQEDFPNYFDALIKGISIRAENVYQHPNTRELIEVYSKPFNIKSLLDYIIYQYDNPVGVICCETTSHHRTWTEEDIKYVRALTVMAGVELKSAKRN